MDTTDNGEHCTTRWHCIYILSIAGRQDLTELTDSEVINVLWQC